MRRPVTLFGTALGPTRARTPADGRPDRGRGGRLADEMTTDWWTARQRAVAGTTPPPRARGLGVAPGMGTPGGGRRRHRHRPRRRPVAPDLPVGPT